nr:immunoglobulin heavy chain junction region [Mus musculus]
CARGGFDLFDYW